MKRVAAVGLTCIAFFGCSGESQDEEVATTLGASSTTTLEAVETTERAKALQWECEGSTRVVAFYLDDYDGDLDAAVEDNCPTPTTTTASTTSTTTTADTIDRSRVWFLANIDTVQAVLLPAGDLALAASQLDTTKCAELKTQIETDWTGDDPIASRYDDAPDEINEALTNIVGGALGIAIACEAGQWALVANALGLMNDGISDLGQQLEDAGIG